MNTKIGYWLWAITLVDKLEMRYKRNSKTDKFVIELWRILAQARANQVKKDAGYSTKGDILGKLRFIAEPVCTLMGIIFKPYVMRKYEDKIKSYDEINGETQWH